MTILNLILFLLTLSWKDDSVGEEMLPSISDPQLDRLSEFTANLGLVFFASVISPLFSGVDKVNLVAVGLGVFLGLVSLVASLLLAKGDKT